jgi:hypothetical protein
MSYVPQNRANLVAAASAAAAEPRRRLPRLPRLPLARVTRRTLALVAVGTALPVGVGAAVVALVHDTPPAQVPMTEPLGAGPDGRLIDRTPLARPASSLLSGYSRLRDPATPAERADARLHGWARQFGRRFGLDPSAGRILAQVDGKRLWLVPGNGYVCLAVQDPGANGGINGGCNSKAVALRDGLQSNDGKTIYGVLPDGIDRIEVTDDDGFRHVEPVVRNAYLLRSANATVRYPVGGRVEVFRVIGAGG